MRGLLIAPLCVALVLGATAGPGWSKGKQVRLKSTASMSVALRSRVGQAIPKAAHQLGRPVPKAASDDAGLNLMCGGDWFIMYEEDANGNPVTGTCIIACDGTDIPFC